MQLLFIALALAVTSFVSGLVLGYKDKVNVDRDAIIAVLVSLGISIGLIYPDRYSIAGKNPQWQPLDGGDIASLVLLGVLIALIALVIGMVAYNLGTSRGQALEPLRALRRRRRRGELTESLESELAQLLSNSGVILQRISFGDVMDHLKGARRTDQEKVQLIEFALSLLTQGDIAPSRFKKELMSLASAVLTFDGAVAVLKNVLAMQAQQNQEKVQQISSKLAQLDEQHETLRTQQQAVNSQISQNAAADEAMESFVQALSGGDEGSENSALSE